MWPERSSMVWISGWHRSGDFHIAGLYSTHKKCSPAELCSCPLDDKRSCEMSVLSSTLHALWYWLSMVCHLRVPQYGKIVRFTSVAQVLDDKYGQFKRISFSVFNLLSFLHAIRLPVKPYAQRNETETKQFQNSFETVSKLFCFSFISLCEQFKNMWTNCRKR